MFKEPVENHIVEQMRVIYLFPWFFDQEMNDKMGALVTKEELKEV
jgi:hypothetical protein